MGKSKVVQFENKEVSEKEELKTNSGSKVNKFMRGAKAAFKDKKQQTQLCTLSAVGGVVNGVITYAVTRDVKESVKYGTKIGLQAYTAGMGFYVVSNATAAAVSDGYVEFLEEED